MTIIRDGSMPIGPVAPGAISGLEDLRCLPPAPRAANAAPQPANEIITSRGRSSATYKPEPSKSYAKRPAPVVAYRRPRRATAKNADGLAPEACLA